MSGAVDLAVMAFRDSEKAHLLADKKDRDMLWAVSRVPSDQMPDYVRLTDEVLAEYEAKREKAGLS